MRLRFGIGMLFALAMCGAAARAEDVGQITRWSPGLDALISPQAKIEKLASGFTWAEGPVWVREGNYLLFTDVPENTIYRWSKKDGKQVYLKPSGATDTRGLREPGANGLFPDKPGSLLVANAGNRTVDRLDIATRKKVIVAAGYQGRKFNSPNDVTRKKDGTAFFTDPPYSLTGINDSPLKELRFNGVYRLGVDGSLSIVDDAMTFPNGIGLSPDERTLYVANSDPDKPIWMAYSLDEKGQVTGKREFATAADLKGPGLPDGLKVSAGGYLFASGPGGVLVFSPDGTRLGRIETGSAIANCAFGDDGRTLYLASDTFIARVPLLVSGQGF